MVKYIDTVMSPRPLVIPAKLLLRGFRHFFFA